MSKDTHIPFQLSHRVNLIKPSPTLAISARAKALVAEGKDIISLSAGEPDFDTPAHITEAAIAAIHSGQTRYTAVDGTPVLKEAIIQKFARDNQLVYMASEILVSCGAKHSLFNLFAAVLNPADEAIIPAPYWVSYPDMVSLMEAHPVILETHHEQQFKITAEQLEAAITPQTRLFILNSPSNPTSTIYSAAELQALGEVLLHHPEILIVTDDIYEHIQWKEKTFSNILMCCPQLRDRCVIVNGVSKAYAMTGWRIGYAAGPQIIINAMKKIQSQSTSNPCSISQAAAVAALSGDQACITPMVKAFHARSEYVYHALKEIEGIRVSPCDGTFYIFPCVKDWLQKNRGGIRDDVMLAEYLLTDAGVAVVPGSAFGAPDHLRISYATSMEELEDAVHRIKIAMTQTR
jgi:aspartate aminotransferase